MTGDPKSGERVRAGVTLVAETASVLRRRLEALDGEMRASVASLRSGLEKLAEDLDVLGREVGSLVGQDGREPAAGGSEGESLRHVTGEGAGERDGAGGRDGPGERDGAGERVSAGERGSGGERGSAGERGIGEDLTQRGEGSDAGLRAQDEEGAKLVALNMALNGESRELIDRYLAEHFELSERSRLLDEVCAAAARQ